MEFYTVRKSSKNESKIEAQISIDPSHPIFEGHFPGQPILPGVCMMQIVRELVTKEVSSALVLTEASNVKFLHIIDPLVHSNVDVEIILSATDSAYETASKIYFDNTTFFSMKAVFQRKF